MKGKNLLLVILQMGVNCMVLAQEKPRGTLDATATQLYEGEPKAITPGSTPGLPPSDAIILLDGTNLNQWIKEDGGEPKWELKNGFMTVTKDGGGIKSKQKFGDIQCHIEWRTPTPVNGAGQERGNSGVYLQERYEIQVLDSYQNRTYSNGQAGAIYKQAIPLVNASRKPGEWQTYDIFYTAPRFSEKGTLVIPAYLTVLHNGVLIHNHVALAGPTQEHGLPIYVPHGNGSILLQDHGNPISYRNIWVREL